jgi:hypothetical protein
MRSIAPLIAAAVACAPPAPDRRAIRAEAGAPTVAVGDHVAVDGNVDVDVDVDGRPDARGPRITGGPFESIRVLAATEDGTVAVTADTRAVRLWPALDGTREPVVVAMNIPSALSIVRDGKELVIAALDRAGGLEVVRTAADGLRRARARVESELGYTSVVATARGVLALRADQRLDRFDLHGARVATTAAPPGMRLAAVLHRRGRTLALLDAHDGVRASWLAFDDGGLRWGEPTVVLGVDPATAQLAPDRDELAAMSPDQKWLLRVDLTSGKARRREARGLFGDDTLRVRPIGYTREGLVYTNGFDLNWWDNIYNPILGVPDPAVATDRMVVSGMANDVALITIDDTRHLGYRMPRPSQYQPIRGGGVLTDGVSVVRVDDDFRPRRVAVPVLPPGAWMMAVDRDHAIMVTRYGDQNGTKVFWIDLATSDLREIGRTPAPYPTFEPSTGVIAGITASSHWIGHIDIASATIDREVEVPFTGRFGEVHVFDPADTGMLAAMIDTPDGSSESVVTPVLELGAGGYVREGKPRTLVRDDDFWQRFDRGEINVIGMPAVVRRRSPDRTMVAELSRRRITLRDVGGGEWWSVAGNGVTSLSWTADGELVAFSGGLAKLDLATGAMTERQCGWRFGIWDDAPGMGGAAPICDAPAE